MLNAKKVVSAFMACTIACSVGYTAGAGMIPVAFASTVDRPAPSIPAGRYEHPVSVVLTSTTPGADIYYTLDGMLPDETSLKFTGTPIVLTESTNISVIALKDGVWSKAGTYGYMIKTTEQPLLKFAAMSDLHIGTNNEADKASTKARYTSNFDVMSSIFKPDAIVIGGDLINDNGDGKGPDHTFVHEVFQEQMARKGWEDMPVQIAIGNHDAAVADVKNGYPADWFTSQSNGYYEKTIKGYSFFFLNGNNYNGDTGQRNWLKGRLAELTADPANLNKPIFITLHHPISGTVMDGQQSTNANLYTDLQDYPQVVVLSGHSHLNINDDRAIYQKDFTSVNLGSMSYVETDGGYAAVTNEGLMENRDQFPNNQSEFIEVYSDRIEIERVEYNGDPGSIINGGLWQGIGKEGAGTPPPYASAGALAGKKWVVKLQGNSNSEIKSNFTYTSSNRNKTAPQFPVNNILQVLPGTNNVPVLSFRQAKDDQSMHHYEIKLYDQRTADVVKTYNVLSDYYFSPIPNKMNIPLAGLTPATSYVITVTAVDVYGNKSAPMQTSYRTAGTAPEVTPIDPATMWNQLVADMKFDGNLNDAAPGATGLATQSGTVSFVEGKSGQAIDIAAGNTNYVDLGNRSDLKFGNGDFTLSFWHKGNLAGDQTVLSNKNWNSGGNPGWYVGPATSNSMSLNMAVTGKRVDYSAANVGQDWHYFTISVDRVHNTASTYVDGVSKATKDISVLGTSSMDTSFNIILGADGNKGNGGATVTLDDLKIWKRALSATEAKALSDSYKDESTSTLYNFNQLTAKIQESEAFIAHVAGTTGLSLPVQVQNELAAQISAAKTLTSGSEAAVIDQAYLDLIWALRAAQNGITYTFIPKTNFSIHSYSSYADNEGAIPENILDGQETSIWHSRWQTPAAPFPHWVVIDMESTYKLSGIQRKSRPNQSKMEFPKTFELYASDNLADLNDATFLANAANKVTGTFGQTWTGTVYKDFVSLDKTVQGRYVKFVVTGTYDPTATYTSMSEIDFTGEKVSSVNASYLTDLKVNGTSLSGFDPSKLDYTYSVPYGTTVAIVTYEKASPTATAAVYGGENLIVGANPITVTVTAQNGAISVYNLVVTRQPEAHASIPVATMTGISSVLAGQSFSMNYGLSNVSSSVYGAVYAQDLTFQFDPNLLEFISATSLKTGLEMVHIQTDLAGQVRMLLASLGAEHSISSDGELLELHWKAKKISTATSASVTLSPAELGYASGDSISLAAVTNNVQIDVLNKSALNALIAQAQGVINAAVEGTGDGQYPAGSISNLQKAINEANTVLAEAVTQQEIDDADSALAQALKTFKDLVIHKGPDETSSTSSTPSTTTTTKQEIMQTTTIKGVQVVNSSPEVVKEENGRTTSRWDVDAATFLKAINALSSSENRNEIRLEVKGATDAAQIKLPAEVVQDTQSKVPDAVISLKFDNVTYELPIKAIDVQGLANALGTDVKHVKINVTIEKLNGTVVSQLEAKIQQSGYQSVSQAVDFTVTAESNGKSITVNDFGKTYVHRTLALAKVIDPANVTAVTYNSTTGEMSFVPAIFTTANGSMEATIKRLGNSIYTVVESSKSFGDLNGHWAKADIELLASKLVIKGMTEASFVPENQITRAEFAALLVRGLGLTESSHGKFNDVKESDWYSGAVGAAVKAGLVEGFEDGTFSPNANLTREQMAVMIARAMALAGNSGVADVKGLQAFDDEKSINGWAKDAVARALHAGIMNGITNSSFMPGEKATRAQAAVILKRLLQFEKFMN
ncbi:S-layer homology domain-containing protein [Paenibacillus sp. P36]|uniref:S-layer homology domain-containing protein n=1 Tax=Paenibacillus sp. P36 TaxID=3342538 RepID=UPI0038B36440